jgi:hypothetical protein
MEPTRRPGPHPPRAAGVPRNPIIPLPDMPIQEPPGEEAEEPALPWEEERETPGVPGEPAVAPGGPAVPGVPD